MRDTNGKGIGKDMSIGKQYQSIRQQISGHVRIVLAGKTRTQQEIEEVIEAGATDIGENYVQEAENMRPALGKKADAVTWHMIGDLQKNKINKALRIFDVIQTVDSLEKAAAINKRAQTANKIMPVYLEINIGSEITKSGFTPEYATVEQAVRKMAEFDHIALTGLMTMGPRSGDPEKSRLYFRKTKEIFERIQKLDLPNVRMKTLSMGMSNTYMVAIEEGANMVRLGTAVFGTRAA